MKHFLLAIVICTSLFASAQITLTASDMPLAGTTQRRAMDTLPLPTVSVGNAGTNQTYDFSNLVVYKYDTVQYRQRTSQQASNFPNADVAITTDGTSFLFTRTNTGANKFSAEGFDGPLNGANVTAQLSPVNVVYNFPATYGNIAIGTWGFQEVIPGSDLGLPALVNNVRVTYTATNWDTIDGFGKTVTPLGAYPSLRNKRKEYSRTVIEYNTIFNPAYTTQSDTRDTTIRYTYHAKESKGALVTLEYDSLDNLKDVIYSMIPPPAPTVSFSDVSGASGLVNFTSTVGGYHDVYTWNFGDGSPTSSQANPSHAYTANGAYYVCLTVRNGTVSTTYCDSVHVNSIVSGTNNAPVAINDYDTIVQNTSTILHVAGNDADADGDNICVTSVWGGQYATEYIGGTCDMILFAPDSTFTGNDTCYYSLCDNGTPVLCDTAMVVFTVTQDASLLPVASFTYYSPTCEGATYLSTAINSDNSEWTFHVIEPVSSPPFPDSTATGDTVYYYGPANTYIAYRLQVCQTVSNVYGSSTLCDTISFACVGINEIALSNIYLYPNPTNNMVSVDMRSNQDAISNNYAAIEVYNLLGERQLVYTNNNSKVASLNVSTLASGMYMATLVGSNGERRTLGRFMKE